MKDYEYRASMNLSVFVVCGAMLLGVITTTGRADPRGASMKVKAAVEVPDIIAVRTHHDMCPYCKQLAPEYKKLVQSKTNGSILYLTLDLSSESTQQQAALLVAALGIQELWTGDLSRIGTVTFVDGTSKQILSTYKATDQQSLSDAAREAIVLRLDK